MAEGTEVLDKPKNTKVDKALDMMGVSGNKKAQKLLGMTKDSPKELKKIKKKTDKFDKKEHKKNVVASKESVLYQDRLSRSMLMLRDLKTYSPVSNELVEKFEQAHREGEKLAGENKWAEGIKALQKVSITDASKMQDKWNQAQKDGEKQAPLAFDLSKQILSTIRGKDVALPRESVLKFESTVTQIMRPLLAPNPGTDEIKLATENMGLLKETLDANLRSAAEDRREVIKLRADVSILLDLIAPTTPEKLPLLTDREAAVLRDQQRAANTAFDSMDYATAREILTPLFSEASQTRTRMEKCRNDWIAVAPQTSGQLERAAKLLKNMQSPEIKTEVQSLVDALNEIATLGPGKGIAYPAAIDRVTGAPQTLQRLEQADDEWWKFRIGEQPKNGKVKPLPKDLPIDQARSRVDDLIKATEMSFGALHGAVHDLTEGEYSDVADAPFRDRLQLIRETWEKQVDTATDLESLGEQATEQQLVALMHDIAATADDDKKLSALVLGERAREAKRDYENARDTAMKQAEALVAVDPLEGADAIAMIEALDERVNAARSEQDVIKATAEVKQAGIDAGNRAGEFTDSIEESRDELGQILDKIAKALSGLMENANQKKSGTDQAPLLALHATLQTTYDGLRAMKQATQLSLLDEAITDATAFTKDVENSIKAARGEKVTDGETIMTFADIRRKIADYKNELEGKDYAKYGTVTKFEIDEKIEAVEKGLGSKIMSALTKDVADIGIAIDKLKQQVADAKKVFKTFDDDVDKIRQKLKADDFKQFKAYVDSTNKRLDGVVANARFEGGLRDAKSSALKISAEIDEVLKGPKDERGDPAALAEQQQGALLAERKQEVEKAKFSGECEVVEKALKAVSGIDEREVDGLKQTLAEAKKAVKNGEKSGNPDYSTGRDQLAAIRKRLQLLEANPNGLVITSRNKLPQVCQRVKSQIVLLNDSLGQVRGTIEKLAETDLDKDGKAIVRKQIAGVRALFNATVFDGPIAKVADKTTKESERSGAREIALRELRRLLAGLQTDYRLQALKTGNPFHDKMDSVLSGLMLALLDLENNLLVSL